MKKSKILMPILGIGAVAATVAPMVTMTACNKNGAAFILKQSNTTSIEGSGTATWETKPVKKTVTNFNILPGEGRVVTYAKIQGTEVPSDLKSYVVEALNNMQWAGGKQGQPITITCTLGDFAKVGGSPVAGDSIEFKQTVEYQFEGQTKPSKITFKMSITFLPK